MSITRSTTAESGTTSGAGEPSTAERGHRLSLHRPTPFTVACLLVGLVLAFLTLFSLYRVLVHLFWQNGGFDFGSLTAAIHTPDLGQLLLNTVLVVGASGLLSILVGSLLAWISERTDARMGFVTNILPLLPFVLPPIAAAVGWVLLLSPNAGLMNDLIRNVLAMVGVHLTSGPFNAQSLYGLILAYSAFMVPLVFLVMSAGLRNMDPALEEQSHVCGAGVVRTFFHITIAGLRQSVAGAILMLIWFGLAMFSVPAVMGNDDRHLDVLTVRIVDLINFTYPSQIDTAVGLSAFILVAVGVAWIFQGRTTRKGRFATVGGKGFRGSTVSLGKWKWVVRVIVACYVMLVSVIPIVGLALVALNGFWSPQIRWSHLGFASFSQLFAAGSPTRLALTNSLELGVIGATIGILAATLLALFVQRAKGVLPKLLDGAVRLPGAISGIVLAVGVLLAFGGSPFHLYGTSMILLIAYIVVFLPQASIMADAAASQVGSELHEAAAVCGSSEFRIFRTVQLPIMAAGLAAGWAMLFVLMAGDLNASAILGGTTNNVVGYQLITVFNSGSYATLAALALVLTIATSVVITVVLVVTRRLTRWGRVVVIPGGVK